MKKISYFGFVVPLAFAVPAMAQDAGAPAASASENASSDSDIVVTASKRAERLVDVPISIVAVSGETLQRQRITAIDQLATSVPGLTYNNNGSNQYYAIRGIANGVGNSPLVGIYIDEADATLGGYGATQIVAPTYDLERVEVLRGPQGTLYGQGSAGGTIRVITKDPELDRTTAMADATIMFTKKGTPSDYFNAAVNIPLVTDKLALRVTGSYQHDGGWIDQPAAGKTDINDRDFVNLRAKLLWKPSSDFTANAMVIFNRDTRGSDITDRDDTYNFTQAFGLKVTPRVRNDYELYNLTTTYAPGGIKIINTATYIHLNASFTNQSGFFPFDGPVELFPPTNYYSPGQKTLNTQFTDELRLSSDTSGPWQWAIGGFYRHYKDHTAFDGSYSGLPGGPLPEPYFTDLQTVYNSGSIFADTSYTLFDRLTLGAGVRYFIDHQNFNDFVVKSNFEKTFHSVDPRFYARYKLTNEATLYGSVAKGFRSGGYNKARRPAYDPEKVWTYEVGAKAEVLDRRLSFDVSVFQSDYKDYQTFGVADVSTGSFFIANLGTARIKGVEWDVTMRPTPRLSLSVGGDYLDAKITKIVGAFTAQIPGDRVNLIPKFQLTASAQYNYKLGDNDGFIRVDYSHTSSKVSFDRGTGPWYFGASAPQDLVSLNASLDLNRNVSVGAFVQNLTNEQGFSNPYYFIGQGVRPRPRTFGVTLAVKR